MCVLIWGLCDFTCAADTRTQTHTHWGTRHAHYNVLKDIRTHQHPVEPPSSCRNHRDAGLQLKCQRVCCCPTEGTCTMCVSARVCVCEKVCVCVCQIVLIQTLSSTGFISGLESRCECVSCSVSFDQLLAAKGSWHTHTHTHTHNMLVQWRRRRRRKLQRLPVCDWLHVNTRDRTRWV